MPRIFRSPTHEAILEVCFSWEIKTPTNIQLTLNVASVIKNMVASAAESEVGACFHITQSGAPLRVTLTDMCHTQPPTHLRIDNTIAFGILNETIKQKQSKAMDM
jgi:hypothetical protein